ncbi:hypothetical protein LIER_33706 [Lithospermum erythrorhizon]|uniref:Uncharacterized protein n=1 Tax=Lithospermum erythrorhizon TaxID=34254 RepID=A0AAV3RXF7_LITER
MDPKRISKPGVSTRSRSALARAEDPIGPSTQAHQDTRQINVSRIYARAEELGPRQPAGSRAMHISQPSTAREIFMAQLHQLMGHDKIHQITWCTIYSKSV